MAKRPVGPISNGVGFASSPTGREYCLGIGSEGDCQGTSMAFKTMAFPAGWNVPKVDCVISEGRGRQQLAVRGQGDALDTCRMGPKFSDQSATPRAPHSNKAI